MNAMLKVFWGNLIPVNKLLDNPMVLNVPFGAMIASPTGGGGSVTSVNGYTGAVNLSYGDVGAESVSHAQDQYAFIFNELSLKAYSSNVTFQLSSYSTITATAAADAATLLSAQTYATNSTNDLATAINTQLASKADLVDGVLATSQIPAQALTEFLGAVTSQAEMLALVGQNGDFCIRTDQAMTYVITALANTGLLSDWIGLPQPLSPVTSVNGQVGVIVLSYADVGAEQAGAVAALQAALQPQIDAKAEAGVMIAALATKAGTATTITAGTGLTGGGSLAASRTLAIANTGVTAGTYGSATKSVSLTLNAQGQVTVVTENTITSSNDIVWTNLTAIANITLGYPDLTHPLQIGKDGNGNIHIRGAFTNTGATNLSGLQNLITIPATHRLKILTGTTHNVLPPCSIYYFNINTGTAAANARYLTIASPAGGGVQYLGTQDQLNTTVCIIVAQQLIGFAE